MNFCNPESDAEALVLISIFFDKFDLLLKTPTE